MNIRILAIIGLISALCFYGCKNTGDELNGFSVQEIDFYSYDTSSETTEDKYFINKRFLPISSDDPNFLFSEIDQAIVKKDLIYLLDWRAKSIFVFDMEGNPVKKLAKVGRGPGEYLQISRFEVDDEGGIIAWDGQSDVLYFYSSDLQYLREIKATFDVEDIKLLGNDRFIISLTAWNVLEYSGTKILITDKEFNVLESHLFYNEYIDNNMHLNRPQLISMENEVAYVGLVDNNVYTFGKNRRGNGVLSFDFGSRNVPDEMKIGVEENYFAGKFKGYTFINNIYAITDNYLYGSITDGGKNKFFFIDLKNNKSYVGNPFHSNSIIPIDSYNGKIISLIHPGTDTSDLNLPDEIKIRLDNEDFVIVLSEIKKS